MCTRVNLTRLTAVVICVAFAVRLCLFNAGSFATADAAASKKLVPLHVSIVLKKRRDAEEIVRSSFETYSLSDILEDDSDNEENVSKSNAPVLFSFMHSFVKGTAPTSGSTNPFDSIKSGLYPRKYLAFSILRI